MFSPLFHLHTNNYQHSWKWLVINPYHYVDICISCVYAGVDVLNLVLKSRQQLYVSYVFYAKIVAFVLYVAKLVAFVMYVAKFMAYVHMLDHATCKIMAMLRPRADFMSEPEQKDVQQYIIRYI